MANLPFYSPDLARTQTPDGSDYGAVVDLLEDGRVSEQIALGNLTLAMIRPAVGPEANLLGLDDSTAAEKIESMICGLGLLAKFSFKFSKEAATEFYGGGPEASMRDEQPIDAATYPSRWPEFVDFMNSGMTTVLLLHSPEGDAIARWRAQVGHWNIDKNRDPATIRGQLAVNKYNNLVHGSDSPEAVTRELGIIKNSLVEA